MFRATSRFLTVLGLAVVITGQYIFAAISREAERAAVDSKDPNQANLQKTQEMAKPILANVLSFYSANRRFPFVQELRLILDDPRLKKNKDSELGNSIFILGQHTAWNYETTGSDEFLLYHNLTDAERFCTLASALKPGVPR
jgi:hypothetical protein